MSVLDEAWNIPRWYDDAACRHAPDPDVWFPERGGNSKAAKAICASCPVQRECRDFALEKEIEFGVWGGTSRQDRNAMKRQVRRLSA